MKGFYIVTKKTNYSLWHQAVTLFTEISKSLIKGKKETTTQKRRYNVHLVSDIDRFSLREPSLAVVEEPVTLNALTMSTINQNCQSKLHASLDVHLCIRRIHHWHLIFFFFGCIALTQTWRRKISMIPAILNLQSFVIRFEILMCLRWKRVHGILRWISLELYCDKRVWFY